MSAPHPRTLVLASTSPYRRALLEGLRTPFEVVAPNVDETRNPNESPEGLVRRLSEDKARAASAGFDNALIIGSDQVALHDDTVAGKPRDRDDAIAMLTRASGTRVTLLTGLAVLDTATGRADVDVVPYTVVFRSLDRASIEAYVDREEPYGCAGALKAEALGVALLERHEGTDPSALIGLPMIRLTQMLREHGMDPLFI